VGQDLATLKAELSTVIGGFVWAPGRVVFDDPSSISDSNARVMQQALFRRLERLETELLIESAYFIPLARGVGRARGLVDRGVRVRVVTNSLASNDILAAFTGYSISPKVLIRAGVELHEVR
jgi:putative cardiolipin synthase